MTIYNATSENRYFVQFNTYTDLNSSILSAQIPEITQPHTIVPYEGEQIKVPGDSREIGELSLTLKLEEDYNNYITIFNWLEYNRINANNPNELIFDTIEYFILDAEYKKMISFTYKHCFPTTIGQIDHTTMTTSGDELEIIASFQINSITLNKTI